MSNDRNYSMNPKILIILLTRNPGDFAPQWIRAQQLQSTPHDVLVIDTESSDGSPWLWKEAGYRLKFITQSAFNHGGTRQLGLESSGGYEFLVYMTQDALLKNADSIEQLTKPFVDQQIAAVCGRQLPHQNANPIAAHARGFNYPAESRVYSIGDVPHVGIKAAFLSDSFAAYRRSALQEIGGFPHTVIFGEDFQVACKFLQAGLKIAYAAEAEAFHSHNYTPIEEFRRYFDAGVSHRLDSWMIDLLGSASTEGFRFIKSESLYLLRQHPTWIPRSLIQNMFKYLGYRLGLNYGLLPHRLRKQFSYDSSFWTRQSARLA